MLIAGEIMVGYDGASSFGRPIIGLLLWSVFCVLGFLVCSPRYSKDFGGTGDFSPESHHEKARVLMGVASGKRDVEDDGVGETGRIGTSRMME